MIPLLVQILVVLILVGAAIAIVRLIPIDAVIKQIIYIVIVVAVCLWALSFVTGGFYFPATQMRQR